MTRIKTFSLVGLYSLVFLSACMEEFDPPSLLAGPRVLGARVAVAGDETRSTPAPGETVSVEWLMALPAAEASVAWGFVACVAGECEPAAMGTGLPIQFPFTVPPTVSGPRIQLLGQICVDSEIAVVDGAPTCAAGGQGTTATVDVVIDTEGTRNRIPDLASRPIAFDDAPWGPGEDCDTLPTVALGSKGHTIALRVLAEDREAYVALQGDPPAPVAARETLQISSFATAGTLHRSFSFVESTEAPVDAMVPIGWDAPATGDRVTFHFVARDLRGGVALVSRTLCLR